MQRPFLRNDGERSETEDGSQPEDHDRFISTPPHGAERVRNHGRTADFGKRVDGIDRFIRAHFEQHASHAASSAAACRRYGSTVVTANPFSRGAMSKENPSPYICARRARVLESPSPSRAGTSV
jgi:hypothetical protein